MQSLINSLIPTKPSIHILHYSHHHHFIRLIMQLITRLVLPFPFYVLPYHPSFIIRLFNSLQFTILPFPTLSDPNSPLHQCYLPTHYPHTPQISHRPFLYFQLYFYLLYIFLIIHFLSFIIHFLSFLIIHFLSFYPFIYYTLSFNS